MSPVAFEIFGRGVYWYGIIISVGVLLAIYTAMHNAKVFGVDSEVVVDLSLFAIPLSIIGARLYYVIFAWEQYRYNLWDILMINKGGLAIYGAVLTGILVGWFFAKRRKMSFWLLADICIPSLVLGQAIGRWGNYFNQEAYGYVIRTPAWQWFPAAVFIEAEGRFHMATFFYESAWNFCIFAFLMTYRKKRKVVGDLFLYYLIFYGLGRLVIEGLRTDSLYWGPFRVSQLLSAILIAVGIGLWIYNRRKHQSEFSSTLVLESTQEPEPKSEHNKDEQSKDS